MARKAAQAKIQYRGKVGATTWVVVAKGKVVYRTARYDDAEAYAHGWNNPKTFSELTALLQELGLTPIGGAI